jgi:hypothetical protein
MLKAQQNIDKFLAKTLDPVIDKIEDKGEAFLDYVARQAVNQSVDGGRADTWTDRTGNLRSSISHVLRQRSTGPYATVFAAMEYAIHVHFRDGYRVLVRPTRQELKQVAKQFDL